MFHQQRSNHDSKHSSGSRQQQQQQQRLKPVPPTRSGSGRGFRRGATWREANANGPSRRMEVSIPQKSLRVFAQAVQCLMKVGKELFIETTTDQLILRTLNDAKSAFAAFYFNGSGGFFETFSCEASKRGVGVASQEEGFDNSQGSSQSLGGGGGASVSCKVLVRAVHSTLRTLKKVVRLVIYVEGEDDDHIEPHLVFQMYCELGYRKVHRFSLQDCEIMHAVFEGEGAARLSCPPVQLSQLLEHIHGTAEVAVGASHDILTVRSYHHPLTGSAERAVLKTEMSISTAEFDTYRFSGADDEEVELVFSLKEIKALLHFSEATEAQTLEMLFREGGDPLLFQSHSNTFAAELIMATMEPRIIRKEPAAPAKVAAPGLGGGGAKREPREGGESQAENERGGGGGGGGGRSRDYSEQADQSQESDPRYEGDPGDGRDGGAAGIREAGLDRGLGPGTYDGEGDSQDSQATRTPALRDDKQRFDDDPFRETAVPAAGDSFGGFEKEPRRRDGSRDPQQRHHRSNARHSDENGNGGGDGRGRDTYGEEQQQQQQQQRRRRRSRGDGEDEGEQNFLGIPDREAQRDSGLPTQFPGVRDEFESELPTQFPGVQRGFDDDDDDDHGHGGHDRDDDGDRNGHQKGERMGNGGGRVTGRMGGWGSDEEDDGPVQGSKRRRTILHEEEDEEEDEEG